MNLNSKLVLRGLRVVCLGGLGAAGLAPAQEVPGLELRVTEELTRAMASPLLQADGLRRP